MRKKAGARGCTKNKRARNRKVAQEVVSFSLANERRGVVEDELEEERIEKQENKQVLPVGPFRLSIQPGRGSL